METVYQAVRLLTDALTRGERFGWPIDGPLLEARATSVPAALSAPNQVLATGLYQQMALSWDLETSAALLDFEVSRSATSGGALSVLGYIKTNSFLDIGPLANSTTYYYKIRARLLDGSTFSSYSTEAFATTLPDDTQADAQLAIALQRVPHNTFISLLSNITTERLLVTDVTPIYDQAGSVLGYGAAIGSPWAGSSVDINVPAGKVYFPLAIDVNNTGQGKMFGLSMFMHANNAAQDPESIRGVIVRLTQDGGAGSAVKTTAASFASDASNAAYDGLLWGIQGQVVPNTATDSQSAAFIATITGPDDKGTDFLILNGTTRHVLGFGSHTPIAFLNSAFRAYMATASHANARAFQIFDNGGAEIAWWAKNGVVIAPGAQLINLAGSRSSLIINGDSNATYTGWKAPATAPNLIYTMPTTADTAGQVLSGDGAGTTSWITQGRFGADYVEVSEITAPSAPASNRARLYVEDNGSGKTRLMVKFSTGAAQQIAIEP